MARAADTGLYGQDVVPARCPVCRASLEAIRSHRMIPVGGRWVEQGPESWAVRCVNSHQGTAPSLPAAIRALARRHGAE